MYGFASRTETSCRSGSPTRPADAYPVRSLPRNRDRCGRHRFCAGPAAPYRCTGSLGAGSSFTQGGRAPLSGRDRHGTAHHHCRSVPSRRCALGDGRRAALQGAGGGDRGNLGRSARARLHCHQTACPAIRGGGCALLADQAGCQPRPECRPRSMAHQRRAVCPASARWSGTGYATLVARSVPFAPVQAWQMDGDL